MLSLLSLHVSKGQETSILIPLKTESCELSLKYFTSKIVIKTGTQREIKVIASGEPGKISNALQTIDYTSSGNEILVQEKSDGDKPLTDVTFTFFVPKATEISVRADFSPAITVDGTTKDIEIRTLNGHITLNNISANIEARSFKGNIVVNNLSGAAQVFNDHGSITVSIAKVSNEYPVTLRNLYGKTELILKTETKASFRIRKERGSFETNIQMQLLDSKDFPLSVAESSSSHQSIYRSVNGGGTPFYLTTVTGRIKILSMP